MLTTPKFNSSQLLQQQLLLLPLRGIRWNSSVLTT